MPLVSIVTATYNRSEVLRHAVASVLRQTVTDWELLVIGDGCTDDTADVLAAFADPRIRFTNLPVNHGEQSVPNNAGVALARGEYLAFLNHDDLWFSDHLATLQAAIERTGAELVYGLSARIDPEGIAHLWGEAPARRYEPWQPVPASVWLMRRAVAERVGPWTSAADLWDSPSQEWLRRAARAGVTIAPVSRLTAVQITSGGRVGSYRTRHDTEHAAALAALQDEVAYREHILTAIAIGSSRTATDLQPLRLLGRAARAGFVRLCVAAGLTPTVVVNAVRYRRRGGFIRRLRKTRGLPPSFGRR
ncbi:MAG: glycosyltransferase [Acidobacteria bacterium]|nr:glycosyltransferase [Acidobacteriota bacterium]